MCVCVYIYTYIYMYIHTYVYTYVHIYIYLIHTYMHTFIRVYTTAGRFTGRFTTQFTTQFTTGDFRAPAQQGRIHLLLRRTGEASADRGAQCAAYRCLILLALLVQKVQTLTQKRYAARNAPRTVCIKGLRSGERLYVKDAFRSSIEALS
jgi:hypothetical protein